jgi:hypothetical protein
MYYNTTVLIINTKYFFSPLHLWKQKQKHIYMQSQRLKSFLPFTQSKREIHSGKRTESFHLSPLLLRTTTLEDNFSFIILQYMELNTYLKNIIIRWWFSWKWLDTKKDFLACVSAWVYNNRQPTNEELKFLWEYLKTYEYQKTIYNLKK